MLAWYLSRSGVWLAPAKLDLSTLYTRLGLSPHGATSLPPLLLIDVS